MLNRIKFLKLLPVLALFSTTATIAAPDVAPPKLTRCNGGVQEAVFHNTRNFPASTFGAAFVPVPDTLIPGGVSGAALDSDVYVVTFSAEASATVGGFWEAQAQYSIGGGGFVPMDPVGANTFHSGVLAQTHTMTWCNRLLAPNGVVFRVVWSKTGGGLAIADDYTMRVERSN